MYSSMNRESITSRVKSYQVYNIKLISERVQVNKNIEYIEEYIRKIEGLINKLFVTNANGLIIGPSINRGNIQATCSRHYQYEVRD